jgi:flagellar biosynthesis GTPase FlhF
MALRRDSTQPADDLGNEVETTAATASVPAVSANPAISGSSDDPSVFTEMLSSHGFNDKLVAKLVGFATAPTHVKRPVDRLAIAVGAHFNFFSLDDAWNAPILLCGLTGAGISSVTAKLAARFDDSEVLIIAAGAHDAAKLEELRDNLDTLDVALTVAPDAAALRQAVAGANGRKVIIDMAGAPTLDRNQIQEFATAAGATGILVASAETTDADMKAAAETASAVGISRIIATHFDTARYLGTVLGAADAAKLALVRASITPYFGFGLRALTPENLARRLMSAAAHPDRWRLSPL